MKSVNQSLQIRAIVTDENDLCRQCIERNGVSMFNATKSNTPEIETRQKGCRSNQTVRSLILYNAVLLCIYV